MMLPRLRIFTATRAHADISSFVVDPADAVTTISDAAHYEPCDIALFYGVGGDSSAETIQIRKRIFERHQGTKIVIESGFVGRSFPPNPFSRLKSAFGIYQRAGNKFCPYMRVGLGGAFGDDADFCNRGSPADRWDRLRAEYKLQLRPYRTSGKHILLIGQVPSDASVRGTSMVEWLPDTARWIRERTERPIVVRLHPRTHKREGVEITRRVSALPNCRVGAHLQPVEHDLENAWTCVTFSSSTIVDALLAGIPSIAMSPASIAYDICSNTLTDLESPRRPEREQWFRDLAYAQWTVPEMADGTVWRHIRSAVLEDVAGRERLKISGTC